MKAKILWSLLLCSSLFAEDQGIDCYGTFSGQLRSIYAAYDYKKDLNDTYATSIGGQLRYSTTSFNGLSGAGAVYVTQDIKYLSGEDQSHNNELSSSNGHYATLGEAYLEYQNGAIELRAGRQVLDTPFANSDDIRMVQNTFEAYLAKYTYEKFTFLAGKLQSWQGYDEGLKNGFETIGKEGAWLTSISYNDRGFSASAWEYLITDFADIFYADTDIEKSFDEKIDLHVSLQYTNQKEQKQSGIDAQIYGLKALFHYDAFEMNIAYNYAAVSAGKESFGGYGGGILYTNMGTMILNNIAKDRNSKAYFLGMSYSMESLKLLYSLGEFQGDADSQGQKADIIEHNVGIEYNFGKKFYCSVTYVVERDLKSPDQGETNWNRTQITGTYHF